MATRVALHLGGGYMAGLDAVIAGTVLAAGELGWEVVGIHDGFEGLLFPDHYRDGGTIKLSAENLNSFSTIAEAVIGTADRIDPFRVRRVNSENQAEEVDCSDDLLKRIHEKQIDAVISVVGPNSLSTVFKLQKKGLRAIAVPRSIENDVAVTMLSFGFNSALSFTAEMLERAKKAAISTQKIGVIEVLGGHSGWLALQSGLAVCADAVLIPEIPYDLNKVAAKLQAKSNGHQRYGLVVVAEGAEPCAPHTSLSESAHSLKSSLAPSATGPEGSHVIERSGLAAKIVALELQRLTNCQTYPITLGQLVKGGTPTAVDQQLGLAYGAAAVRALHENHSGVMVAFAPPEVKLVPLSEAINRIRTVPLDSVFVRTARSLGICLGD